MARLYTFELLACSGCSGGPRPGPPDPLEAHSHVVVGAQEVPEPLGPQIGHSAVTFDRPILPTP